MKHKNQTQFSAEESGNDEAICQQGNGIHGTTSVSYTDEDREKGNLKNFDISKKTIKKLKARNVEYLLSVQRGSFQSIHEKTDCLIQASNGSGKTLAYVIPMVELIQSDKTFELTEGRAPRVLVLASTREATKRVFDDFQSVVNELSIVNAYKSKKKSDDQEIALANGCDILVATPEQLKELIDNEKVSLSDIKHVVLDDIDRMIESDMTDDIKKCLKAAFASEENKAQLVVFSQTLPDSVRKLTKKYLSDDCSTINLTKTDAEEAKDAEDEMDDDADDDDEDDDEPMKISSSKTKASAQNDSVSLLGKQENYTTYKLTGSDEIKGAGFVFTMLRKCFGEDFDAKGIVSQIAYTTDFRSAVFDLPSEYNEQIKSNWKNTARIQMVPITELPEMDEASMNDKKSFSRSNNSSGYGGGGNRNSSKPNACFNCQKEGHKSWECPDGNSGRGQRNGNNRSGGGGGGGGGGGSGCFNCGKEGHRSFECTEPKKSGGRSSGGERSNACFNCGKDGHKSFECSEPKKANGRSAGGERSNSCFNCGKDGHKSFECPEPKKGRPSMGGRGGGGGGRGGSFGAKRSFGGYNDSGNSFGDTSNKKIKFDDDD